MIIDDFKKEKEMVMKFYKQNDYLAVIIVGVQLLEKLSDYIAETIEDLSFDEYGYGDDPEEKEWKEAYDLYKNNLRKVKGDDAPRAKVLTAIYDVINHTGFEFIKNGEVLPLMHKVERVVAFRNDLAHNYFTKSNLNRDLAIRSKECLELIEFLENYPLF
jgi:hypothetical protein